jgi:hypothetical protein
VTREEFPVEVCDRRPEFFGIFSEGGRLVEREECGGHESVTWLTRVLSFSMALGALASGEEVTGYVSEAHCGAKHSSVSEANSKCIADCLIRRR